MKSFFLLLIFSSSVYSAPEFILGSRSSFTESSAKLDNTLNYFEFKFNNEEYKDNYVLKSNVEFRVFDPISSDEGIVIDPVNVSLELLAENNSFQFGFLRYRFSETFGLQILDVANPRDYSEYFLNDLSWAKRSVFGLNMLNKIDRFEAMWMMTLWGNGDRLPYRNSSFDLMEGQYGYQGGVVDSAWFKDIEYGTRFKYLFENGLDVSLLAYHHHSRPTLVNLSMDSQYQLQAKYLKEMVNSLGTSFSQVFEEWVLRGDALVTFNNPINIDGNGYEDHDQYQVLLGVDRIWRDWTFGIQGQRDFTFKRQFYGFKAEFDYFEWWKPSAMIFISEQHQDQWLQFKNSFIYKDIKFSVTWDKMHGTFNNQSFFGNYRKNDRFLMDLAFHF